MAQSRRLRCSRCWQKSLLRASTRRSITTRSPAGFPQLQSELVTLLEGLRSSGHSIAAYGAAAKGTTLLNSSGVLREHLDFVVDRNVHKHGRYMPGLQTPIYATERLLTERPDYVLLLAWNFKGEIIQQQSEYLSQGGRFIVPVPEVSIVDNRSWLSAAS